MDIFEGPDRIEFSPLLGRPLRQGSWAELSVSERTRIHQAIEARDSERLTVYWGYLHFGHSLMLSLGYEWALRWQQEVGGALADAARQSLLGASREPATELVCRLLQQAEDVSVILSAPQESLLAAHLPKLEPCLAAASRGDWEAARQAFEQAFEHSRDWHHLLFRFSWACMSALLDERGQDELEGTISRVLTSTSFYEPSWQQAAALTPQQLAVVLAEHLRLHFSGPDGSVAIAESEDEIRLMLTPCGSGGAMRQAVGGRPGFRLLAASSPLTWGRMGEVPAYCAHCAVNEVESLRRFGWRKWQTLFDPDPEHPCAWVLPKRSPTRVPEN